MAKNVKKTDEFNVLSADVVLTFFNKYRQLAVFDRSKGVGNQQPQVIELLSANEDQRFTAFSISSNTITVSCTSTEPQGIPTEYNFAGEDGAIWWHYDTGGKEARIVIGMGDIRDGFAEVDSYKIEPGNPIIIGCTTDFALTVYRSTDNAMEQFSVTPNIFCP